MKRQTAVAVVVSFALAMISGVVFANRNATAAPDAQTTAAAATTSTEPRAHFVNAGETVVGPAVLVAGEPQLDGDQLVVNFELTELAPLGDAEPIVQYLGFGSTQEVRPEDLNTIFLEAWTLTTPDGDIGGGVANPMARAARFDVGPDFDLGSITEIAISKYALLSPVAAKIDLNPGAETSPVAPGVSAHLLAVTEQVSTIVQVELISQHGFSLDAVSISGTGPGWVAGVREAEGRPRWNLTYDAPQAPSPIELTVSGSLWISVDTHIAVAIEAPK